MFRNLKPDYEIFLWVKSFDCTGTTQYKNESQLLREFKQATIKRKKKTQAKKYQPYQKKYQTNSESEQINTELNQLISTR
ncbi:12582_t:CDS:1, partial [Gigaspora rosea]